MTAPVLDAATARAYHANVRRFYAYRLLSNLQLWFAIWVLYLQQERGLTLTQITALDAPFWLVMVLAEIPTGAVADRWGRKRSLLMGSVMNAAAIFLFGIASTFWLLLLSYLVWGLSMTLVSGADSAFLYDSLAGLGREREFRKTFGRARAFEMGAGLVGALLGAPLASATSLGFPIVLSAGIVLLGAGIVLTFHEPRHHETNVRLPYTRVIGEALALALRRPALRAMILLNAVLSGAGMAGFIFVQPFLAAHDVPVADFGLLSTPQRLASVVGALVVYRVASRFGERNVLYGLGAAFTGALLVLAGASVPVAVTMFAVLSFCTAAIGPVTQDYVNRHAPQHLRATLASVAQMASSIVLAVSEPTLGLIGDRASLRATFLVAAIGIGLLGGVMLAVWTAASRAEQRAAEREGAAVGA